MALDLHRWLNGEPVLAQVGRRSRRRRKSAPPTPTLTWLRRHLVAVSITVIAVVVAVGLTGYIIAMRRQIHGQQVNAEKAQADADKAAALAADLVLLAELRRECDLFLERGKRLRDDRPGDSLLYLARADAAAIKLSDAHRRSAIADVLETCPTSFGTPPGLSVKHEREWHLVGHTLLGLPLKVDDLAVYGTRLPYAGSPRLTGFAGGGRFVMTANEPAERRVENGRATLRLTDPVPLSRRRQRQRSRFTGRVLR